MNANFKIRKEKTISKREVIFRVLKMRFPNVEKVLKSKSFPGLSPRNPMVFLIVFDGFGYERLNIVCERLFSNVGVHSERVLFNADFEPWKTKEFWVGKNGMESRVGLVLR
jgi:hypothetical protein